MTRFVALRLLQVLAVLAIMSFIIYALIGLMPGDPIDLMLTADPHLTAADAARLKSLYGLDRPLAERYLVWAKAALNGDFGYSRLYATPAIATLLPRLGNTALLMGSSFVLALAIALPLGAVAARRPGSFLDNAANLLSFTGISLPPFWFALLLILVFAVTLGWLPAGGVATIGDGGVLDRLRHLALPVATLTLLARSRSNANWRACRCGCPAFVMSTRM
jgi:peptide/nickel transport system permease protein